LHDNCNHSKEAQADARNDEPTLHTDQPKAKRVQFAANHFHHNEQEAEHADHREILNEQIHHLSVEVPPHAQQRFEILTEFLEDIFKPPGLLADNNHFQK